MTLQIHRTGTWLYNGVAEMPVDIISLDYDWWYELAKADGQLEEGEVPMEMGKNGLLYYVRFQHALQTTEPTWVDSGGQSEISEAIKIAEAKVVGGIRWHE